MIDEHYQNSRLTALYDLDSGWSQDREFYFRLAGDMPMDILDLGCGTGLLCDAYASKGHKVTGVDPAAAMLDVARDKPHGKSINWIQATAQDYHESDKSFDLIIMTGHAFQTLLTRKDMIDCFATMRQHLKRGGKIVFESRNPQIDWATRWDYEMELATGSGPVTETRKLVDFHSGVMTFDLIYGFKDGESLISKSTLRFFTQAEIEAGLRTCGLRVESLLGDWQGGPCEPSSSEEMIFVVRQGG